MNEVHSGYYAYGGSGDRIPLFRHEGEEKEMIIIIAESAEPSIYTSYDF